jgi:hypothetical protein
MKKILLIVPFILLSACNFSANEKKTEQGMNTTNINTTT